MKTLTFWCSYFFPGNISSKIPYISYDNSRKIVNMSLHKKCFPLGFYQQMWPNPQLPADLVTVTEEILNEKLHFLCSVSNRLNKFATFLNDNFCKLIRNFNRCDIPQTTSSRYIKAFIVSIKSYFWKQRLKRACYSQNKPLKNSPGICHLQRKWKS